MFKDKPQDDAGISQAELELIESGGGVTDRDHHIPWKAISSAKPVWALCTVGFAVSWVLYIFLSWLPSYFSDVHGLDLSNAGLFSLAPWITMFVMMNVGGWVNDLLIKRGVSITATRKIMACIGLFGAAGMMIFLRSVNSPEMATVLMCAALGIAAFTYSAMVPNSLDIAPRYAAIVYGIVNTFGTLAGAIGAMAAGYIVEATGSYDKVFMVSAGLLITAGIIYVTLGSGEAVVD